MAPREEILFQKLGVFGHEGVFLGQILLMYRQEKDCMPILSANSS